MHCHDHLEKTSLKFGLCHFFDIRIIRKSFVCLVKTHLKQDYLWDPEWFGFLQLSTFVSSLIKYKIFGKILLKNGNRLVFNGG